MEEAVGSMRQDYWEKRDCAFAWFMWRCVCVLCLNKDQWDGKEGLLWRQADSLELAEDVCVLGRDAARLQNGDAESENTPHFQMLGQTITQFCVHVLKLQVF